MHILVLDKLGSSLDMDMEYWANQIAFEEHIYGRFLRLAPLQFPFRESHKELQRLALSSPFHNNNNKKAFKIL